MKTRHIHFLLFFCFFIFEVNAEKPETLSPNYQQMFSYDQVQIDETFLP